MNAFEQYSTIERQKLEKLYQALKITHYTFTAASGFDKVEGTFTLAGRQCVVEAKCRNFTSTRYNSHLIEQPKHDELRRWWNEGYTPLYVNFFTDGAIIYNLTKRFEGNGLEFNSLDMPRSTAGDGCMIVKKIAFLEFDAELGDKRFSIKPR